MMEAIFQKIKTLILEAREIVIFSHYNPDGDAVGAMLGLTLFLHRLGKTVYPLFSSPISRKYTFLKGIELLQITQSIPPNADLFIFLDCASKERSLPLEPPANSTALVINIDHHEDNTMFGNINLVLPQASSTGEIIYLLCQTFQLKITPLEAAAFYVSLVTDTGGFRFKNTTPQTLHLAANLIEAGAVPADLIHQIFEVADVGEVKLLGLVLATLEKSASGEIVWVYINKEMFAATNTSASVVEDFINQINRITGVKIALLFREEEANLTKVSIRTIEGIKANSIAARFGGGGHSLAAGCHLNTSLSSSISQMLSVCEEVLTSFGRNNQPQ